MKFGWRGALGIALSAFALWYTLRGTNLREIWDVLMHSSLPYWVACIITATTIFPLRARRWQALLAPVAGRLPLTPLWQSVAIGMMASNVASRAAGEPARAFALNRAEPRVKFTTAFASVAVDRLFDGTVVLLMMILAFFDPAFTGARPPELVAAMTGTAIFLTAVLVAMALMVYAPRRIFAIHDGIVGHILPRFSVRSRALLEGFVSGLHVLRDPKLLAEVFFWTVLHWLCNALAFWFGFKALGLHVPPSAALLLQGVIAVGVAVPSTPGFFGVFEAFSKIGLGFYGVNATDAASFGLGFHILSYIPITIMGAVYLSRMKLHFRDFSGGDTPAAA
jgi:hypothetical protein